MGTIGATGCSASEKRQHLFGKRDRQLADEEAPIVHADVATRDDVRVPTVAGLLEIKQEKPSSSS